jgi:hypothetical protein
LSTIRKISKEYREARDEARLAQRQLAYLKQLKIEQDLGLHREKKAPIPLHVRVNGVDYLVIEGPKNPEDPHGGRGVYRKRSRVRNGVRITRRTQRAVAHYHVDWSRKLEKPNANPDNR